MEFFSDKRWWIRGMLVASLLVNNRCNLTGPAQNLEPLPYQEPNQSFADQYYLDSDSLVSLTPKLTLMPSGTSSTGALLMQLQIAAKVINQSQKADTVESGRATVYIHHITRPVTTVLLVPGINTVQSQTVLPGETYVCNYINDPIDEIPYDPLETEYFAVFTLTLNSQEYMFVTQIANPGGN